MTIEDISTYIATEILGDPSRVIGPDDDLLLTEMLDSLSVMRLVAHLETVGGTVIPPEDVTLEHFQTVRLVSEYLATRS
ncbi:MAG: acyl carrier protein [Gemmatimonadota bacterium]